MCSANQLLTVDLTPNSIEGNEGKGRAHGKVNASDLPYVADDRRRG